MNDEQWKIWKLKKYKLQGHRKAGQQVARGDDKDSFFEYYMYEVVKNGQTWSNVSKSPLDFIGSYLTPTVFYHLIINISKDGSVYFSANGVWWNCF